jgi:hypothetical protein
MPHGRPAACPCSQPHDRVNPLLGMCLPRSSSLIVEGRAATVNPRRRAVCDSCIATSRLRRYRGSKFGYGPVAGIPLYGALMGSGTSRPHRTSS